MKIEDILKVQKDFAEELDPKIPVEQLMNNLILALFVEVGEFANEVQTFKHWKNTKIIDRKKILYEFIDILKIWGSLAHVLGFTVEELERAFNEKTEECYRRKEQGY